MCTLFLFWESQCGGELGQLHQTETGGCKTPVNGCRRPSIPLTSPKMIYLPGDPLKYEVGCVGKKS